MVVIQWIGLIIEKQTNTGRQMQDLLGRGNEVDRELWPFQSADLNPIKHQWQILHPVRQRLPPASLKQPEREYWIFWKKSFTPLGQRL